MNSTSDVLDQCIGDYKTKSEINDFLISVINKVLNGISEKETIVSESMISVEISADFANFFQDIDYLETATPDLSLPTADFREVAVAWLNYVTANGGST